MTSMFDTPLAQATSAIVDDVLPTTTSTETETVDVVKLARDKQTLEKKVADWEDKVSDAMGEIETAKENLQNAEPTEYTLEEAEADLKIWRNAQNKVDRLSKNLETYKKMLADATEALKAAVL